MTSPAGEFQARLQVMLDLLPEHVKPQPSNVGILHLVSNCPGVLQDYTCLVLQLLLPFPRWWPDFVQLNKGGLKILRSMASSGVPGSITTATKMKKTRRFQVKIRQCGNWATQKS